MARQSYSPSTLPGLLKVLKVLKVLKLGYSALV